MELKYNEFKEYIIPGNILKNFYNEYLIVTGSKQAIYGNSFFVQPVPLLEENLINFHKDGFEVCLYQDNPEEIDTMITILKENKILSKFNQKIAWMKKVPENQFHYNPKGLELNLTEI